MGGRNVTSSVHRHAAVISAALTQGVKWGWLDTSPATRASSPPAAATRKLVTPTTEYVAKLIKAAQSDDPVMAAAVARPSWTGARRGELAASSGGQILTSTPARYGSSGR